VKTVEISALLHKCYIEYVETCGIFATDREVMGKIFGYIRISYTYPPTKHTCMYIYNIPLPHIE